MEKVWKDIAGYKGIYHISNYGDIERIGKAAGARIGRALKQIPHNGYYVVWLSKNNSGSMKYIHVLVLETFVCPRPFGKECNHKNGIKIDNRVENLEWVTHQENIDHSRIVLGTQAKKLSRGEVTAIRDLYRLQQYNQCELAELVDLSQSTIHEIIHYKIWKHV